MTVELADLIPALTASLNVPGDARPFFNFDDDAPWLNALAAGFWNSKSRGFYTDYRVDVEGEFIENIVDDTIDIPREDQTILVLQTALNAVRAKFWAIPMSTHSKAGPVETEVERSSTLLRQLFEDLRTELEAIKTETVGNGNTVRARVIDGVLARSGYIDSGIGVFVN